MLYNYFSNMNKKTILLILVVFSLLIIGMFVFAFLADNQGLS